MVVVTIDVISDMLNNFLIFFRSSLSIPLSTSVIDYN